MTDTGPVQLLAIGFGSGARYEGKIVDVLDRLERTGLVRVLDLLVVGEDSDKGELVVLDYRADERGGLVAALLGFALAGTATEPVVVEPPSGRKSVGLTRRHLERIARGAPDMAIGVMLVEHVWASELKRAIRDAGGEPLAEGFLSPEALADIDVELEETVTILEGI
jgi:hypothetical protein